MTFRFNNNNNYYYKSHRCLCEDNWRQEPNGRKYLGKNIDIIQGEN